MTTPLIDVDGFGIEDSQAELLRPLIKNSVETAVKIAELSMPAEAELSVLLANDEKLKALNNDWRGKDKPTNVLSFPGSDVLPGEAAESILGDIVISVETTKREAELENKRFDDHFTHLIIHGLLHLFGYDHETEEQALQMETLETEILAQLGITDPYENGQTQ